jgi:ribosomal protein S18 acetylase RimI-like enzyme
MTATTELVRVGKEKEKKATATVLAAFADDPMARALRLPETTLARMYELPIRLGLHAGEVYATSVDAEGVMIVVKGEHANFGFGEILRLGSVRTALGLGRLLLNRHMRRMFMTLEADQKALDIGPYLYLSMPAVAPEHQGKGHGGRLLRYLCDRFGNHALPILA